MSTKAIARIYPKNIIKFLILVCSAFIFLNLDNFIDLGNMADRFRQGSFFSYMPNILGIVLILAAIFFLTKFIRKEKLRQVFRLVLICAVCILASVFIIDLWLQSH